MIDSFSQLKSDLVAIMTTIKKNISQHGIDNIMRRSHVIQLTMQGKTIEEIQEDTGFTRKFVLKWYARNTPFDLNRPGRPLKITQQHMSFIKNEMYCQTGVGYETMKKKIEQNEELENVGKSTIRRHVKKSEWGNKPLKNVNNKPLLTALNISSRQHFHQHLINNEYLLNTDYSRRLRENVLFTDESIVELYPEVNSHNAVWRGPMNLKPTCPRVRFSPKIMIAGGFNANGKTPLIILPEGQSVTGEYYRENILPVYLNFLNDDDHHHPGVVRTLMSDGAPAHFATQTRNIVRDFVSANNLVRVWERPLWPGNSPDLNPIENLWPILQDSVHQEPRPTNLTELATRVNEVWEGIDSTHLSNLSNSMVKRMELLQMNNYLPIKY